MKNTTPLNVALLQHAYTQDPADNMIAIKQRIIEAANKGAQLIVLQELHNTPYFCQIEDPDNFDLSETIPGPTTQILATLAQDLSVVIVASLFERRAAGLYHNTAVVIERDGRIKGIYRKMHIPDDPGYYEKFYFTPGDDEGAVAFRPIKTSVGSLGILVCWDQWYPEAARLMALAGADLLIYPTAIGWDPADDKAEQQRQLDAWQIVQRGHAVANGLPLLCCNRIGREQAQGGGNGHIDFWGSSFVCGPQGELLSEADSTSETLLMAEIDLKRAEQVRRLWPFLRDRRIDLYAPLSLRYRDK